MNQTDYFQFKDELNLSRMWPHQAYSLTLALSLRERELAPPFEKGRRGRDLRWSNFLRFFKSPLTPLFQSGELKTHSGFHHARLTTAFKF